MWHFSFFWWKLQQAKIITKQTQNQIKIKTNHLQFYRLHLSHQQHLLHSLGRMSIKIKITMKNIKIKSKNLCHLKLQNRNRKYFAVISRYFFFYSSELHRLQCLCALCHWLNYSINSQWKIIVQHQKYFGGAKQKSLCRFKNSNFSTKHQNDQNQKCLIFVYQWFHHCRFHPPVWFHFRPVSQLYQWFQHRLGSHLPEVILVPKNWFYFSNDFANWMTINCHPKKCLLNFVVGLIKNCYCCFAQRCHYHSKMDRICLPAPIDSAGFSASSLSIGTELPWISNNTPIFEGGGSYTFDYSIDRSK